MPVIGFLAPDKTTISPVEYLRRCSADRPGYMDPIVAAGILKTIQNRGRSVTASMLVGCPLSAAQKLILDHTVDPQDLVFAAFRGTIIHQIAEIIATKQNDFPGRLGVEIELAIKQVASRYLIEKRFYRKAVVDGVTLDLSGQIDRYRFDRKQLLDYKTLNDRGFHYILSEGARKEHVAQVNFQRWLMAAPEYEGRLEVKRVEIGYVGMGGVIRTGRFNRIRSLNGGELFKVAAPEPWPLSDVEEQLLPTALAIHRAFVSEGRELPPADPGKNDYRCPFCPFNGSIPGNWTCPTGERVLRRREGTATLTALRRRLRNEGRVSRPFDDIRKRYGVDEMNELTPEQMESEIREAERLLSLPKPRKAARRRNTRRRPRDDGAAQAAQDKKAPAALEEHAP